MGSVVARRAIALVMALVACTATQTSTSTGTPAPAATVAPTTAASTSPATSSAPAGASATPSRPAAVVGSYLASSLPSRPCPDRALRRSPVALEHISSLGPIGSLVPPGHVFPTPHMYFYVKNDATPGEIAVPLLAPADLVITTVAPRVQPAPGGRERSDFTLTFAVCDGYEGYFHHVVKLVHPELLRAFAEKPCTPVGPAENKSCSSPVKVAIAEGDRIGTAGDAATRTLGVDLGVRDYRSTAWRDGFARPDRFCTAAGPFNIYDHCYAACPLDAMPDAVRAPLVGMFTNFTRTLTRTEEPRCGLFAADRPGTAQGRWISAGQPVASEEHHLFLGPYDYGSVFEEISVGGSIPGISGGAYLFKPAADGSVRRRFSDVRDGSIHCYDGLTLGVPDARGPRVDFAILLQLRDGATKVALERRDGTCGAGPWALGSRSFVFER